MVDPVSAIAIAGSAFKILKSGFAAARDIESMSKDLGRWSSAMADLDFAQKQNQKPPWYKKLGGGVQAEAVELWSIKVKADAMRSELKDWVSAVYGPSHWTTILEFEAQLRQEKRETEYARIERNQKIIEWVAGMAIFLIITGSLIGLVILFWRM